MHTEEVKPLDIVDSLRGQRIFITGATGFLGKVLVEKLLWSVPEIGKLLLLIRPERDRRPTMELASHCIRRAHKRVLGKGSSITPETPSEKLHRLRIDCKKLRYLLEFFRSLYPAESIGGLVTALKRLQDNLGDFNDYGVHQRMLKGFAAEMVAQEKAGPLTVEAIGLMVEQLEEGESLERQAFSSRFAEFASPATVDVFEGLF
jgi:CHAD domain-containing protein